jgi:acyl-coenzyme A synthetase/AMP-(fatty) acid ligase
MVDFMNRPFLIEGNGSLAASYDAMFAAWASAPVSFRPFMLGGGFIETLLEVAKALVFGRNLVLYDADFSPEEFGILGGTEEKLGRRETLGPLNSRWAGAFSELMDVIRASEDFSVTVFTSGSTGLPKQVTHTLQTLARGVQISPKHAGDIWGFAYNPTHIAGLQVFLQAFLNLNPLVELYRLSPDDARRGLLLNEVTHLSATPTFYRLLLEDPTPIPTLTSITLGGERSTPHLIERVHRMYPGARVRNIYASTEAGTLLIADGEYFRISKGMEKFVRINQNRLEIHASVLGDFSMRETARDEWYDSGDVVEVSAEDHLRFRILGRAREWINVGGSKVNPTEVEAVLTSHPSIREARVFGRKNSVTGEIVCAEVIMREGALDEKAIVGFLNERLQSFKVPRIFVQLTTMERTRTGKLKRNA